MKKTIVLLTIFMAVITGCYYDNGDLLYSNNGGDCSTVPSFTNDIKPLFVSKCSTSGCHSAGVTNSGGPLVTYAQIKSKSSICKTEINSGSMPIGSTLTTAQKKLFSCWVDNGSPNN